ncbi:MAG TPA: hypothetical protein DEG71_03520 [Clostridiales bacterium]|nr:hypothetical protein [Clostridiales bacterium]
MIFIIIGAIVGLCLGVFWALDEADSLLGRIGLLLVMTPLGVLVGGMMGTLVACLNGGILYLAEVQQERVFVQEQAIYTAIDNQGTEGNFALGCGRVSDTLRYYYVVKDDLGQKVDSANSTDTHIINTTDTPKIKTYETNFKNKKWILVGINFKESTDYILEVPENTVKYDYSIDLK